MSAPQSVAEILNNHVTFELECIDRMYLNVYVPALQFEGGVVKFFRSHRGHPFASSALMDPMTKSFVAATERFAKQEQIPVVQFRKGQRKDDVMAEHLARFDQPEGVVMLGKAQEKTPVFRTEKRRNPETGKSYPWIVRSPFLGWLAAKHSMRVPPLSDRADAWLTPTGSIPNPQSAPGFASFRTMRRLESANSSTSAWPWRQPNWRFPSTRRSLSAMPPGRTSG